MKAAFPILTQKDQCEAIQRLPCVAYTLQLAIGKGLAPVEILAAHTKRIINFFSTQKQIERLEEVQHKLGYEDIMRCIQDVQTRWNSSFYAWDRLFYLKDAIIQLQTKALIGSVLIWQSRLKIQVGLVRVDASTRTEMYSPVWSGFRL
jgi:hypothetical protein